MDEARGTPGEKKMEHEPHRQSECRHPAGPVQRLLHDLRSTFCLVVLEVVGEEQTAGARRAQLVALAAHEDTSVSKQLVASGIGRHARATFANGVRRLRQVELRQYAGDRLPEPCEPSR